MLGVRARRSGAARVMLRSHLLLIVLVTAGCTGASSLQPASTVPAGTWRLGAQALASPWCSTSGDPATRCAMLPDGTPLPEVRLSARRGLDAASDVGLSVPVSVHLGPREGFSQLGLRAGVQGDYKRVLWRRSLGEGREQLLSIAPGLGLFAVTHAPRNALAPDVDLALPLLFGHQSKGHEWVLGLEVAERLRVRMAEVDPARRLQASTELGLFAAVFSRDGAHSGWQVGYHAPLHAPGGGRFTLGFAFSLDVGTHRPLATQTP